MDVADLVRVCALLEDLFEARRGNEAQRAGEQDEQLIAFETAKHIPGFLVVDEGDVGSGGGVDGRSGHGVRQ